MWEIKAGGRTIKQELREIVITLPRLLPLLPWLLPWPNAVTAK